MEKLRRIGAGALELWKRIGFYVSLFVVLCLVGAAAYTIRTGMPRVATDLPMASESPEQLAEDAPAIVTASEKYCLPVEGAEVSNGYSLTEPIWSRTLLEWHVHRGIDFAAPAGAVVMAVADGTVSKAEQDPLLGYIIEIDHGGGLTTRYGSLMGPGLAKAGDKVRRGDAIGGVGSSAASESAEGPHLHFESYRMDEWAEILEPYL